MSSETRTQNVSRYKAWRLALAITSPGGTAAVADSRLIAAAHWAVTALAVRLRAVQMSHRPAPTASAMRLARSHHTDQTVRILLTPTTAQVCQPPRYRYSPAKDTARSTGRRRSPACWQLPRAADGDARAWPAASLMTSRFPGLPNVTASHTWQLAFALSPGI